MSCLVTLIFYFYVVAKLLLELLIMDQFETNFYAPVNIIKAVLPLMREKKNGHIIVLTGVSMFKLLPFLELLITKNE